MQIIPPSLGGKGADCPNLKALLADPAVTKLFHFARFDIAALLKGLGVVTSPVICTKIASKLVRTYTDRHGLKELCRDLAGGEISKQQQTSDWGAPEINEAQRDYAAADVRYLHRLKEALDIRTTSKDTRGQGVSLNTIGYIELDRGNFESATARLNLRRIASGSSRM